MIKKSDDGIAGIGREVGALAASAREAATADAGAIDAGASSLSIADEAIREIGQEVSQALLRFVPSGTGKFALDIHGAIGLYGNHLQTHKNLGEIRGPQPHGRALEALHVHDRRMAGDKSYTTDGLASMRDSGNPEYSRLKKRYGKKIEDLAKRNRPQADSIRIRPNRKIRTSQIKNLENFSGYFREFKKPKYRHNEEHIVPKGRFEGVRADYEKRIKRGGKDGELAKEMLLKLRESSVTRWETKNPRLAQARRFAQDTATRTGRRIGVALATDVALIAIGGVAWEIREAYRDPGAMTLMERVERLLRVVWSKVKATIRDRALRELGFEALSIGVSMLAAPLKIARAALSRIWSIVQRLWMDFVAGKIKRLADVVSAILKAVYSAAVLAITIAVERQLSSVLGAVPGGEMLSAVLAAAVAGMVIVIGNRGIEAIVRGLAAMSARVELARRRREEIERFCAQAIPMLIADRDRLEELVDRHLAEREVALDRTFADMAAARDGEDIGRFLGGLNALNAAYGKTLQWGSQAEFDTVMQSDEPLKL